MIPLVVSKLKAAYLASLVVFAGIAIPTSTIAVNQGVRDGVKGCFIPIIEGVNKIPEIFKNHVITPGEQVVEQYKKWVKESGLKEKFNKENAEVVAGGVSKGVEWLEKAKGFLSSEPEKLGKLAESGNYYTFEFSPVIKSAIDYLPTLSKETVTSLMEGGKMNGYLSLPKMVKLFKAGGVKNFGKGLVELYKSKPNAFNSINKKDTDTIFEIIKSLDDDNINSFWTDAKNNMDEIKNDTSKKYDKEDDSIWRDIFIGKDGLDNIITALTKMGTYESDTSIKTLLESIEGIENSSVTALVNLANELKSKLEALKAAQAQQQSK